MKTSTDLYVYFVMLDSIFVRLSVSLHVCMNVCLLVCLYLSLRVCVSVQRLERIFRWLLVMNRPMVASV